MIFRLRQRVGLGGKLSGEHLAHRIPIEPIRAQPLADVGDVRERDRAVAHLARRAALPPFEDAVQEVGLVELGAVVSVLRRVEALVLVGEIGLLELRELRRQNALAAPRPHIALLAVEDRLARIARLLVDRPL